MPIDRPALDRLRNQMRRGECVLFVGAGFSLHARNREGTSLPDSSTLTRELWTVAFPGEVFDEESTLGDVFYVARRRNPDGLRNRLRSLLSVDTTTVPEEYRIWLSMPWAKCYTLNQDDLESAVARRFDLPRTIRSSSATSGKRLTSEQRDAPLEFIHLNGTISDELDNLTFSDIDYADGQQSTNPFFLDCAADLISRPVVFVGTSVREPMLWRYIQMRRRKGPRGLREMRPGSYLIVPELSAARRGVLSEFNIDWIPMTSRDFARGVLTQLGAEAEAGLSEIRERQKAISIHERPTRINELLSSAPGAPTDFLQGEEPTWRDLTEGVAIERDFDRALRQDAAAALDDQDQAHVWVLSGTAGSGKSASLMRLAVSMNAEGFTTYWVDAKSRFAPHEVSSLPNRVREPLVICIDDADTWGTHATGWVRDFSGTRPGVLLVLTMRSARVGRIVDDLDGSVFSEHVMPPLTDDDITELIGTLDKHNRLGALRGLDDAHRIRRFKEARAADRQLLVAMIETTSGEPHRQKIYSEFADLTELGKSLYAIVALASARRTPLSRHEIVVASGDPSNETVNALEQLTTRGIVRRDNAIDGYRTRHRVIADEIVDDLRRRKIAVTALDGLCWALASQVRADLDRGARPWRRLISFINHDYILAMVGSDAGRTIYQRLEDLLGWDFHFWLQRGSLEVEDGSLDYATNFLGQARSLSGNAPQVETEWGYLLMKKAARRPQHPSARAWYREGREVIERLIDARGGRDPYPFHVLGSQTLAWTRQSNGLTELDRRMLLRSTLERVEEGLRNHPRRDELIQVHADLKRDWLATAVD